MHKNPFATFLGLICSLALPFWTAAQESVVTTSAPIGGSGPVVIHPVHHASFVMEWNTTVVSVDPTVLTKHLPAPQIVLITDIHGDHLDTAILGQMDLLRARIIAPKAVSDLLPPSLQRITTVLANGDSTEVNGIRVQAVPMYNMPDPNDPRHPKGRGNGYVVTMGKQRIYISGDTEDIPEMRALKNIDMAFVCMNLPYTMTIEQAASGVLAFRPKVVYPYHYRGEDGFSEVETFMKLVMGGDPTIEVRLENWYKE